MTHENNLYQSLISLQRICLTRFIPFASYRLPLQTEIITLVQDQSVPEKIDSLHDFDKLTGFVVAPFIESENHEAYILKPDRIFQSDNIDDQSLNALNVNTTFLGENKPDGNEISDTRKEDFIQQVENAKNAIAEGKLHKVVLSHIRLENMKQDFDASAFYLKLCQLYPHAFVYFIQLPQVGCWIGATPEPLLVIADSKVKTVSLAGTQVAVDGDVHSARWSNKEIEEQGIVTSYIERTFRLFNIENYSLKGPVNYQAANLIHLKSSFEFGQEELGNRLGEFLYALHPTPSVGGLPKLAARDFIRANEKHDRAYYSGFLGPLNIENKSNLFVNLRCLQLLENQFVLYSGAGITSASDAEKEWEETNNKMLTLLSVIHSL